MTEPRPQLFPRPREHSYLGGKVSPNASLRAREDHSLPPGGYSLRGNGQSVEVRFSDSAGLRYAEDTWAALNRGGAVRAFQLRDWPEFPVRGFLLDISRDRVPTRETLAVLVERLGRLRFNHLQLYVEHSFAHPGHEVVWREASPITGDDLRWLDARCAEQGIELAVNQNTFGHMERWLRHPAYRERAEAPDGWSAPGGRHREAGTLAPSDANAEFALELVREQLRHVRSRRVNINCDETFELGHGRSRDAVESRGRVAVFAEHLLRLVQGLHDEGCEVLFWGDMLRGHPERVKRLPAEGVTALVWHYEAPCDIARLPVEMREALERFEIGAEVMGGFERQLPAFAEAGLPFWVCPGTSSWNSLLGRLPNARANLRDAAIAGRRHGASGFLLTDWGDSGHLQPPSVSLPPLVDAAGLAWNPDAHAELDLAPLLDELCFEDEAGVLGEICVEMGALGDAIGQHAYNASPLHHGLLGAGALGPFGDLNPARVVAVVEQIEALRAHLAAARPRCADGNEVVREIDQALRLARHAAWRLLRDAGAAAPDRDALRLDLAEAIREQRACWLARARPGGLDDSLARLDKVLAAYDAE